MKKSLNFIQVGIALTVLIIPGFSHAETTNTNSKYTVDLSAKKEGEQLFKNKTQTAISPGNQSSDNSISQSKVNPFPKDNPTPTPKPFDEGLPKDIGNTPKPKPSNPRPDCPQAECGPKRINKNELLSNPGRQSELTKPVGE